ncbi:MAG TPA: UPF0149 family protein [Acetobacteraceae bacterium]|nr:UPF0149 family protein [Acetobacteraceae bacterium]
MALSAAAPGQSDLDALNDYLMSSRSPQDCMDLSELDGFMAGIVAGPEPVATSEWLPMVWDGEEPVFDSDSEAATILGAILRRFSDIASGLDSEPATFAPVFWEGADGKPVVEDWAHGFMQAVSMRTEAWAPVLRDEDLSILLIPIGIIATRAVAGLTAEVRFPEDAMEDLMEDADTMLAACAVGLRAFWRDRASPSRLRH